VRSRVAISFGMVTRDIQLIHSYLPIAKPALGRCDDAMCTFEKYRAIQMPLLAAHFWLNAQFCCIVS